MKRVIPVLLFLGIGIGRAFASSYDDLNAGIRFHNLNQHLPAIAAFDVALQAGDLTPDQQFIAHLDRGLSLTTLGRYELATADYSACLDLEPKNVMALLQRANSRRASAQISEALEDINAVIAVKPKYAPAYNLRAALFVKAGKLDLSLSDNRKALSLLPVDYTPSIETGIVEWQIGDNEQAIRNFSYSVAAGQHSGFAWLWLAMTRSRMDDSLPLPPIPAHDNSAWPWPIADFFAGNITRDAILGRIGTGTNFFSRAHSCEANFYIGEWLALHHQVDAAKPLLQSAADTCEQEFAEWVPAQLELARLTK